MPDGPARDHADWEDRIIEVLDGRADDARRAALEEHLALCPACRVAQADYVSLFARLREPDLQDLPASFWDALALDVDRRLAPEVEVADGRAKDGDWEGREGRGQAVGAASRKAVDLSERTALREGWNGVTGGLAAAAVAVLVLVGLYLELPRSLGRPEAFVVPPRPRVPAAGPAEPAPTTLARLDVPAAPGAAGGEETAEPLDEESDLDVIAADLAGDRDLEPEAGVRDPLADLADPEPALQGLTPEEAEELLLALESRT